MIPLANRTRSLSALLSALFALAVILPYSSTANAGVTAVPAEPAAPHVGIGQPRAIVPPLLSPPFSTDPVSPIQPPATLPAGSHFYTETGHLLSSAFYTYYASNPDSAESRPAPQRGVPATVPRRLNLARAILRACPP